MKTLELNKIHCGDCIETLKQIESNSVDSIVTDPPYELGFMGKKWDSTGIANNVEMWQECLRVLKPGGHLLAFSGTRTYHRMAVAIEDAGFEIRDMIEWVYGSGFPKSLNIGKAVDNIQGNEREVTHEETKADSTYHTQNVGETIINTSTYAVTKGTSEWEGWGTALKPAHEPICMARKPLAEKSVAENCLKYGTGGINIDESRVEFGDETDSRIGTDALAGGSKESIFGGYSNIKDKNIQMYKGTGRFPANLIHDNSEEVRECFPETKTGAVKSTVDNGANQPINLGGGLTKERLADSGNASRFFKSIIYQAKASKSERNKGCEGLEKEVPGMNFGGELAGNGKPINIGTNKNHHPTVKPVALMEYLIKMVTPKGGIVLDPFAGSGTTGVACKNLNRNYILIEKEQEYCKIAEARINNGKRQ